MPVAAHNRYWAADTTYAKKNNGSYDFYVETEKAIPDDPVRDFFFTFSLFFYYTTPVWIRCPIIFGAAWQQQICQGCYAEN